MTDPTSHAPRSIQLPAVLQVAGQAPCFGTIAAIAEQGLSFDFQTCTPPPHIVGSKAILDFNFLGQHHAFNTLFVHVQGRRALLSLREASPSVLGALHAVNRHDLPPLAVSLSILQRQHACHLRFMEGLRAVVDDFYRLLPEAIEAARTQADALHAQAVIDALQDNLTALRPQMTQQFGQAFPMYPEQRASYAGARTTEASLDLVDMDRVDDWIRRTTVAQRIEDTLAPLPHEFNRHYNALLKNDYTQHAHPYRLESVLNVLADLIAPLGLEPDLRIFCYTLMGRAFEQQARALYPALIQTLDVEPDDTRAPRATGMALGTWLKAAATQPAETSGGADALPAASAAQVETLNRLLAQLTQALETGGAPAPAEDIPALHAHDRILARFLPPAAEAGGVETPAAADAFGRALGRLSGLDDTALDGLRAQLLQPPPIDPGPEQLPEDSQVRTLLLQAQGLVLQYTLNGLTYQSQPDHPAWTLLNELDALHHGADDQGRFLDAAQHKTAAMAMQWLLDQDPPESALPQFNALLAALNAELLEARQARRDAHLQALGAAPGHAAIGWCVVKHGREAIPHEILGLFGERYALLNRSATRLIELPHAQFAEDVDSGRIEEAPSYDQPFLARTASAALTASLDAVHAFTWKDPASGCLKRSALMDALERRLEHPVMQPPTFCALIEIPSMRPSLSELPGDELSVLQTQSGELLLAMLEPGEQCGRLSDVSFMVVFAPQDPQRVSDRLARLKGELEGLHPSWKMIGAVVPLVAPDEAEGSPSSVLRRANAACAGIRQQAGLDLSGLDAAPASAEPPDTLPLSSLYLRCQKILPCDGTAPAHYEILLGLDDALTALHSTQSFVVMAEQTGRIRELDTWVMRAVFDWMERNTALLERLSGLSINLSGACISDPLHVDAMAELFAAHPDFTRKLILEVTETSAIDNLDLAARALRTLKKLGCRIALDDFGSGYSSYGYVRRLPLDYLKIDGTYIRNILTDRTDQALTASMVDVAHALGIKVIAEYVDSEATYAWLRDLGVDYVQGYWVHEPQRLDTLAPR